MKRLRKQSLRRALGMLTIEQAAIELSVTPRIINNEIQSGRLTCYGLGNSGKVIRIIRTDLQHFADRNPWNVRMMRAIAFSERMASSASDVLQKVFNNRSHNILDSDCQCPISNRCSYVPCNTRSPYGVKK